MNQSHDARQNALFVYFRINISDEEVWMARFDHTADGGRKPNFHFHQVCLNFALSRSVPDFLAFTFFYYEREAHMKTALYSDENENYV